MGFSLVVYPLAGLYSATRALLDAYGMLATEGTTRGDLSRLAHFNGAWRSGFSATNQLVQDACVEGIYSSNVITVEVWNRFYKRLATLLATSENN